MRVRSQASTIGALFMIAAMLTSAASCGRRVELIPVEGRVMLAGRPLAGGSIMLQPLAGPAARSPIDREGRFRMSTYRPGDGVIAGPAAVRVTCFETPAENEVPRDADPILGKSLIPEHYTDFRTSGLTVNVVRGMQPPLIELSAQ